MATSPEVQEALRAVQQAPHAIDQWQTLEQLAAEHDAPDDVVEAYRAVLAGTLAPEVATMIGERAASFCDEWFGDDPKVLEGLLARVLVLAPQSEAALQRMGAIYGEGERWSEMLALYDRALDVARTPAQKVKLLREASQLAKDVANQPDKAIGYLQRLLPLVPDDPQVGPSLERLLERHERWADLISLWDAKLETLPRKEREQSRLRIARVWLEQLREPARALAAVKPALAEAEAEADAEATSVLEKIIEFSATPRPVREGALDLLRTHYDGSGRAREVIRVLERVIEIDPTGSRGLREEAGARLAELDDDKAAMDHYSALLALTPDSSVTQEKLRQLAQRSNNFAAYANGVAAAGRTAGAVARRVELLAEAARTRLDVLDDAQGATALYQEALGQEGAGEREQLVVSRRLAELYSRVDRPTDRLDVLERLAVLEVDGASQRAVLGEAARLAESLGDLDRALILWQRRLDSDAGDHVALDARVELLERASRWPDLIAALEQRVGKASSQVQQRSDLQRIAVVQRDHLADAEASIRAWQKVAAISGEDAESVSSLADLYAQTGRWREMADLLARASSRDTERTVARLNRLGGALYQHLDDPPAALGAYRDALAIAATDETSRQGLLALLASPATRAGAAESLATSFRRSGEPARVVELRDARLAEAADASAKLAILREAASLQRDRDPQGAIRDLAAAFRLAPLDALLEAELRELALGHQAVPVLRAAYEGALDSVADRPREAVSLRRNYADLLGDHADEPAGALMAYGEVLAVDPTDRRALDGVMRHGVGMGEWALIADAALGYMQALERLDDALLDRVASAARAAGSPATDGWVRALTDGITSRDLGAGMAAPLWARLARLHRDDRHDGVAAVTSLRRALELGGDRAGWLAELVELERAKAGGRPLLDALLRLSSADGRDLDVVVEAADVAAKVGDKDAAVTTLTQVLGRAGSAWRGSGQLKSSRAPEALVRWAVDGLVELHRTGKQPRAAIDVLTEAAGLPFDAASKRALRMRAADIAASELGDNDSAIDMTRAALAAAPGDLDIMARLASLLEAEDRVPELLSLRQAQLAVEIDSERKLQLRLDIAKLVGMVEARGGRIESLRTNLSERPGHEASVDALATLLGTLGRHGDLTDILEQQATAVETGNDHTRASRLWARAARTAEAQTKELERAIASYRRAVALAPTQEVLRSLARLNLERNQPAQAVPWLENLLGMTAGTERMAVAKQLADAHIAAKQPDRAVTALEGLLDEREPSLELRAMLIDLYREQAAWEPLARHLTKTLPFLGQDDRARAYAREAAEVYGKRLMQPGRAVPAIEIALTLEPGDKDLRAQLASGLRDAGRLPEARAVITELITDFGRRRSPERAALHVELARIAQAEAHLDEAMTEMEQASKMDVNNASIQKELAEMARDAGQLDKAERTYRALLLVVRRQPPGDDEAAVGSSEVLFELHRLATQHGQAEQARELLESAIEAATQSDAEVRRMRRSVLAHKEPDTMLRVIDLRLKTAPEALSQAKLLADKADVLDRYLGRGDDALDAMIAAMGQAPSKVELHDKTREVARKVGKTRRYVDTVELVVDRLRRKDDPPLVAQLLMKAGEALERDAGDLPGAANLYRRVEMIGERLAESFYAQARIAGELGDTDEQARALDKMLQLAGAGEVEPSAEQVDALYRLAEIFIGTPSRRTQGLGLLERAFAAEPRWGHAGRVLKVAAANDPNDARVLALYERVARNAGDAELLLDFLERRAGREGASAEHVREAVAVALDIGQYKRAEALLNATVSQARAAGTLGDSVWAAVGLAERRLAVDDLATARDLMFEIAALGDGQDAEQLARKLASKASASPGGDSLAAEVYEFLRERHPSDRAVWEPLCGVYRKLGDGDRLSAVVTSTLPSLVSVDERNSLRLEHARFLLEHLRRQHDAIDILKEALADDPDHAEAALLLEDTLRALGDDEGLADFLWGRFDDAQRRGHRETTVEVAHRLGQLLDRQGSPDAARVYRAALAIAPDDRDILRQVVAHVGEHDEPREAALIMERLLAVEVPESVPRLAQVLANTWEQAGDTAGVQRTLELAHRTAPENRGIHDRLEEWYREHQLWAELADLMTSDAERLEAGPAVTRLREAAGVYNGVLGQPLKAAAVLRTARGRRPTDAALATELAAALGAGGRIDEAQEAIALALVDVQGPERVNLLTLSAGLQSQLGNLSGAVDDHRAAYELDPEQALDGYSESLEQLRQQAAERDDLDLERKATLGLIDLMRRHGQGDRARDLLVNWIERDPRDAAPLAMLCDMDEAISHWDGVLAAATRMAYITEGEAQIAAAMRAASAAVKADKAAEVLPVLEVVHAQQPGATEIRNQLREAYEAAGAFRELAGVLIADADHGADAEVRFANYRRAAELLLYQAGDAEAAAGPAARALEMSPEDHGASMMYVDVLLGLGRVAEAQGALETSIAAQKKRTPELAVLQQRMARVCAMQNDRDGQVNWLKKAFDVDRKNAEVAAELATVATEMGDYELALKPLRAITLMENPAPVTRPMALLWEARIEYARGNKAKAELWAKKALREDPTYADAQTFLDELSAAG